MSSCFISIESIDGQPTEVRNFTGDVTIQLTSAYGGDGAPFIPPACNDAPPSNPIVVQDTLPAYTMHMSVSGQSTPVSAPEPGALALLVVGLVALVMRRTYRRAH
jgi:MYXO-CTERM domain-containing protein